MLTNYVNVNLVMNLLKLSVLVAVLNGIGTGNFDEVLSS